MAGVVHTSLVPTVEGNQVRSSCECVISLLVHKMPLVEAVEWVWVSCVLQTSSLSIH